MALVIVVDKPSQARWLTEREKQLVFADLEADRRRAGPRSTKAELSVFRPRSTSQ